MRCFLLVLGTRGDLELYLTLGRRLQQRGHEVVVGTSPFFQDRVQQSNLKGLPIGTGTWDQMIEVLESLGAIPDKVNRILLYFERWLREQRDQSLDQIQQQAYTTDYLISNVQLVLMRNDKRIPGAAIAYDQMSSRQIESALQEKVVSIQSDQPSPADAHDQDPHTLYLVAMNKLFTDPKDQWDRYFHFTGFWLDETPYASWMPSNELESFLRAGTAPVVLTMGSMIMFDTTHLIDTFIEALKLSKQRGILIGGWAQLDHAFTQSWDQLYVAPEIPYPWLLPQASCVVHHGGIGTAACVLKAGKPSILLPQIPNQDLCAQTLMKHKLATGVFEVSTLTPTVLADAIQEAVSQPIYKKKARFWQTMIRNEDGARIAVDLIETHYDYLSKSERNPYLGNLGFYLDPYL